MNDRDPTTQPAPALRLTITPEPTAEEAAAIAAAFSTLAAATIQEAPEEPARLPSSWVVNGRLAAHHAAPRARQRRWSRTLAWLGRS